MDQNKSISIIFIPIVLVMLCASNLCALAQRGVGNEPKGGQTATRIALVIGNAAYTTAKPLVNPVNDANDMTAALKSLGFEVLSGTNQNKRQIETLIRQFGKRLAETKGTGLFYYAGHGLQVSGENYLVPVDAEIPEADEVLYQAVPMNMVLSKMNSAGNDLNIVILDACRNNPFARSWRGYRDAADNGGLARITPPQGTIVLYATQPGNIASDGTGKNGLFTESLLKQIKRENLELDQMIKALTRDVSEKSDKKQFPWREGSSTGDFYFVQKGITPNPKNPQSPKNPQNTKTASNRFFTFTLQQCKASGSTVACDLFITNDESGERPLEFYHDLYTVSKIFDDYGNEVKITSNGIGNKGNYQTAIMLSNVQTKAKVVFTDISLDATELKLIKLYFSTIKNGFIVDSFIVEYRNVVLIR